MQSADQHVQCWKWVLDVRLGGFEDSFFSPPGTLKAMMHYNYWGTFVLSKNVSFSSVFMLIILASRFSRQALLIPFLHSLNYRRVAVPLLAHIWFDLRIQVLCGHDLLPAEAQSQMDNEAGSFGG